MLNYDSCNVGYPTSTKDKINLLIYSIQVGAILAIQAGFVK